MSVSELKNNRDVLSLEFSTRFNHQDTAPPEQALAFTGVTEFSTLQHWHDCLQDQLGVGIVIHDGKTRVKKDWAVIIKLWINHTRSGYVNPYKNIPRESRRPSYVEYKTHFRRFAGPTTYPTYSLPPVIRAAITDARKGPTRDINTHYGVHAFLLSASLATAQTFCLGNGQSTALHMLSVGANKRALELLINKALEWTAKHESSPITLYPLRPSKRSTELRKHYEGKKVSGLAHEYLPDVLSPKLDALRITAPEHFLLEQWKKTDPLALSIVTKGKSLERELDQIVDDEEKRAGASFKFSIFYDQCERFIDSCLINSYDTPHDTTIGPLHDAPFIELFNQIAYDISVSGSPLGPVKVAMTDEQFRKLERFNCGLNQHCAFRAPTHYVMTKVYKIAVIFSAFHSHRRLFEERLIDNESFDRALAITEWHYEQFLSDRLH